MKKNLIIIFLFAAFAAVGQHEVRFKVTNSDPVTGKRMIVFLTGAPIGAQGYPVQIIYMVRLRESDEVTPAAPANNTERAKRAVQEYEEIFYINERKIDSTTLLYLPDDTTNPNAITLADFFRTKSLNSFPGVSGNAPVRDFAEGLLRQMVLIKRANGDFPL
jgi:hypothetical protein